MTDQQPPYQQTLARLNATSLSTRIQAMLTQAKAPQEMELVLLDLLMWALANLEVEQELAERAERAALGAVRAPSPESIEVAYENLWSHNLEMAESLEEAGSAILMEVADLVA